MLKKQFPDVTVGLSDHFNGILSGPIAYMMGAKVFEKHVTFNRAEKGTDHSFSLEPEGFRKFTRDIHRVPKMMKPKNDSSLGKEPVFMKLGKSIVANKNLNQDAIYESLISLKRAGSNAIITYFALDIAQKISKY